MEPREGGPERVGRGGLPPPDQGAPPWPVLNVVHGWIVRQERDATGSALVDGARLANTHVSDRGCAPRRVMQWTSK
jgi:hypothetical protein